MKILLVDDHILFAKSLSIALCDNPEIEQFSSTKDIQNLEKQIATELPDILLIDINLGGLADEDGLMLTQHLLERFPDQKIVILSGYNLPVYRKEAKSIGARGFISKDVEPDELLHILLTIKDGATHFPREEVFISKAMTSWLFLLSRLPVGSSAKISLGFVINARPMATRCCCPPDS